MNFDFGAFLKFPGVLVIIGLILIIIAIIIGLFATKKEKNENDFNDEYEADEYNIKTIKLNDDEEILENKDDAVAEPISLIKDNFIPTPIDDEIVLEDVEEDALQPAEEDFLDTKEFVILDIEEKKDNIDVETL